MIRKVLDFLGLILGMAFNLIAAIAAGAVLLTLIFLLPTDRAQENMARSATVIAQEGSNPMAYDWCYSLMDNWTDSIILLEASDQTADTPIHRAMLAYRGTFNPQEPAPSEDLVQHYHQGKAFPASITYSRYWHGFLLLVKPLLLVTDYVGIRVINTVCQLLLMAEIILMLRKRGLKNAIVPYILAVLMLTPPVLWRSMQYSACYYLFSFGMLLVLYRFHRHRPSALWYIFLNIGIAAAYFDFLTYPMITYGIPAVTMLLICAEDGLVGKFLNLIRAGIGWCAGYIGMWGSKWILTGLLTGEDGIADALASITSRTSATTNEASFSAFHAIRLNVTTFLKTPATVLVLIAFIWLVVLAVKKKGKWNPAAVIPLLFVAVLPLIWYAFTVNHSEIHFWYTNKALAGSVFACLCAAAMLRKPAAENAE